MALHLVRHAKAGSREHWSGHDRDRPLTTPGRAQAERLADRPELAAAPRLLSSPYVRCVQTLQPLAARLALSVEPATELAEGGRFEAVLALLSELPDGAVLCSHGDVIPDVVAALERRGATVRGEPDWRKGSTWVLERTGSAITAMRAVPPPSAP